MPVLLPVPTKAAGDLLTSSLWNSYLRDNINKLLQRQHRVVTVAQFAALTGLEGTKGTTPPDEVYVEVDLTNGIQWHLAYESGEATYKWRFIGGPPLRGVSAGTVTLPRGGDYDVDISAMLAASSTGDTDIIATVTPSSGAVTGRNSIRANIGIPVGGTYTLTVDASSQFRATGVSASATLPWSGDTTGSTGGITTTPVRII